MKLKTIIKHSITLSIQDKEELARVMLKQCVKEKGLKAHSPQVIFSELRGMKIDWEQEQFIVILLDGGNQIIEKIPVTKGLVNSTQVHPREVFKWAIRLNAASMIVAHNHPSGNLEASPEDKAITKKLIAAAEIISIPILDHIVFSHTEYISFMEQGLM